MPYTDALDPSFGQLPPQKPSTPIGVKSVYVAAHCRWAGLHIASVLKAAGFTITSRWLDQPFGRTSEFTVEERQRIADEDVFDVAHADALVLLGASERHNPAGGKFVEAGIALGLDHPIVIIGRRENMLLWYPGIESCSTPEEAAVILKNYVH